MKYLRSLLFATIILISNGCMTHKYSTAQLKDKIAAQIEKHKGRYAVAFKNLSNGEEILINEHENFHAASTMKTPVMIEVFKQVQAGNFSMNDSITLKNEFKSIVDESSFSLSVDDDSEFDLYKHIGENRSVYQLMYNMIIMSSNFATNLIIDLVGAENANETMREMGAKDIQVLRGVEDDKAYEKGMNNTTTAYDLMLIFSKIANGEIVSKPACDSMIDILSNQHFNSVIPAKLPKDVKVAHKTGSIISVQHDSGIVFLPDGKKYVLVLLSKDWTDEKDAIGLMADISKTIYDHVENK
ncbi:serine hydrolase [Parafilimonas terrae]|nr:serine hydrolase [Parafilimonas terrae]